MNKTHYDVLIVGAGLSGIGAAVHLQKKCPGRSYQILEMREAMGGTWDLFRYPGIRSDSDMHTLGFNFKPWNAQKAIADGPAIREYIEETAEEYGINPNIRYGHKVVSAEWASDTAKWIIQVKIDGKRNKQKFTCNWLHMCAGYYKYEQGYTPEFEGRDDFKGDVIHPQLWPEDYDYSGKKVVVIGSGATAMTLVPAMTDKAEHVTMLQRSPTYVVSRPAEDKIANGLRKALPNKMAYGLTRWKNVLMQQAVYRRTRTAPDKVKEKLLSLVREELGPDFDVEKHFTPSYNPWDQRLCLVPDSDLFVALREKKASVVTDHIDRFTETGIKLKSGEVLEADIIITATGLDLQFIGGTEITVDGWTLNPHDLINYRGAMISGIPNMTSVFGYTNASWTLRADLTSEYMCKVLNHLERENYVEARPVAEGIEPVSDFLDFSSGYVQRAMERFPQQGKEAPWIITQNYTRDIFLMRHGKLEDGALIFRRAHETVDQVAGIAPVAAE
ncbi:MAG: flavin-containing monooxygenase [Henriciella sp.]